MPYSNIIELRRCLEDCLEFCENHPDDPLTEVFWERLQETISEIEESIELTNKHYSRLKMEMGEDKIAWKKLSHLLEELQDELDSVDAIGFPRGVVSYWDEEQLLEMAERMRSYLKNHREDLDFADDYLEKIERYEDLAEDDEEETVAALDKYFRFSQFRRDAISNANQVIADFRESMREAYGTEHDAYQSIRWAMSVSPDETVL